MKNKALLNGMKKNYFKIPNKLYDIQLSLMAIGLYTYLAKGAEEFNPSINTIAKSLSISNGTVVKYLSELKNRNIIKVYRPGYEKHVTKYELVPTFDWIIETKK